MIPGPGIIPADGWWFIARSADGGHLMLKCTYYHDEKTISLLHPSYHCVLAEFSRLLSTYIVFLGRASFNWAVDCPGLVLFLTGPAHDDNGAQRSSRYLLASSQC